MRPDYCPVANEPCQAMCALSDVRCKIRDTAPLQRELRRLHEVNAELLEALKKIQDECRSCPDECAVMGSIAQDALAKATGEQQ
jgi:tRNA nucleotidyltransferase (CCA-adding enzyme)